MQQQHTFTAKSFFITAVVLFGVIGVAPRTVLGGPIIQEVFYGASGPDATEVLIEIF